jgi:nicotinamide phosphoribosyltransferase
VVALMKKLEAYFGTTTNSKGFKVLDSHVGLIWGDGIDPHGIDKILNRAMAYGYSAENFVFGMGGGLLQKVNRDTQRFAFKSSAQKRSGVWYDVCKSPLDSSKASKRGRLRLVNIGGEYRTLVANDDELGLLKTVFLNGEVMNKIDLDTVRENAKLDIAITVPS